jgi:hypothetical protein
MPDGMEDKVEKSTRELGQFYFGYRSSNSFIFSN